MRDFTINNVADEIRTELGLDIPKSVLRKLLKSHFRYIIRVMKTDSDRILMRENDIHTIYREISAEEVCGKVADLDETKVIKKEKNFAILHKGLKPKHKLQKRVARKMWKSRYMIPELKP